MLTIGIPRLPPVARDDSIGLMENYFNYFTEIEEHFQRRRGSGLLLSTLDWALIETWKDSGIALEAVLRGIDSTFDRYDARPSNRIPIFAETWLAANLTGSAARCAYRAVV